MAAVSEILTAQAGAYRFGERDCVRTLIEIYRRLAARPDERRLMLYFELARGSEADALARLAAEGGPLRLYPRILGDHATVMSPGDAAPEPGDILFYDRPIRVGCHLFDAAPGAEAMAFLDDGMQALHWTPGGLLPVEQSDSWRALMRIA